MVMSYERHAFGSTKLTNGGMTADLDETALESRWWSAVIMNRSKGMDAQDQYTEYRQTVCERSKNGY
jgi:hypothetical protein